MMMFNMVMTRNPIVKRQLVWTAHPARRVLEPLEVISDDEDSAAPIFMVPLGAAVDNLGDCSRLVVDPFWTKPDAPRLNARPSVMMAEPSTESV